MSKIEWTERTWNPIVGCSVVSPGCTNCYAMKMAARLDRIGVPHYAGLTQASKAGPVWTGKLALAPERTLLEPLRRKAPTMYFVNSMGDLFHEDVPDEWIDRVFAVMALSQQHMFQVLTKRSARLRGYLVRQVEEPLRDTLRRLAAVWPGTAPIPEEIIYPLPNVWLGVSAEDQTRYDERKEDLRNTPAAVHFFSFEPLLGEIRADYLGDWVIVGGESGPGARPMHPDWARSIRDQCQAAGVPFFFKQWGEHLPVVIAPDESAAIYDDTTPVGGFRRIDRRRGVDAFAGQAFAAVGKKVAGRLLDGREWSEMPNAV